MAKIYVASSWRNPFQQEVVNILRDLGHEVYDFKNPPHGNGGFQWSDIDPDWQNWTTKQYQEALNPPYSRPLIEQFVKRLAEHGNGIALLFNRCDSKMFQDVIFKKATAMKFLRNRIRFFRPDGTRGDSPGCGSVLIAFGRENAEILRNCSLQGKYVELNNDK